MQTHDLLRLARVALALVAPLHGAAAHTLQAPAVGQPAPEIRLDAWVGVEPGAEPTSERLRGKLVMVEFWGTWCAPCVQAMPHVQELHDRYGEPGLVVLASRSVDHVAAVPTLAAAADAEVLPRGREIDGRAVRLSDHPPLVVRLRAVE